MCSGARRGGCKRPAQPPTGCDPGGPVTCLSLHFSSCKMAKNNINYPVPKEAPLDPEHMGAQSCQSMRPGPHARGLPVPSGDTSSASFSQGVSLGEGVTAQSLGPLAGACCSGLSAAPE